MPVSMIWPNAPTPSGSMMPLMRYCRLACSLRTCSSPLAAESCDTPGTCSSTLSSGVLVPCGSASSACWVQLVRIGAGRRYERCGALHRTSRSGTGDALLRGLLRRRRRRLAASLDTTWVGGRRGCTRFGAVISIFGSATRRPPAEDGGCEASGATAGAAVGGAGVATGGAGPGAAGDRRNRRGRRRALASRPGRTAAARPRWRRRRICLFNKDVTSALLPMVGGLISIGPGGPARDATIQQIINQSRSGDRGRARLKRDADGVRDGRIRRPWSGTRIRRLAAAAAAAASQTTRRSPSP